MKTGYRVLLSLMCVLVTGNVSLCADTFTCVEDTISGKSLAVIQAALPEALRFEVDVEQYRIVVFEEDDSYLVLFEDPDRSVGQLGSAGKMPELEVEIAKLDLRIIRANFVR